MTLYVLSVASEAFPLIKTGGLADVVARIEEQLSYPGQIRVTVIRESRAVDYAR